MTRPLLFALVAALLAGASVPAAGPRLVAPGVIATGDSESHATLSPDGRTLLFVKLSPDFNHWTVVSAARTASGWSAPEIAWFSGRWDDADLSFAPDGDTIYFISNRPQRDGEAARPDTDLFRMRRSGDAWSAPERLAELASPGNEWFPNATATGTLYFGSERRAGNFGPDGTADLWRAPWLGDRFGPPENLGPAINTAGQEIEPWISADESTLVFAAKGRPGALGSYDFYVAYRCGGAWSEPKPLAGGVNSPAWDFAGRFTPDGKRFLFASNRTIEGATVAGATLSGAGGYRSLLDRLRSPGNGLFDLYEIDAAELGLANPCAVGKP
jgi:hypothetical protein